MPLNKETKPNQTEEAMQRREKQGNLKRQNKVYYK